MISMEASPSLGTSTTSRARAALLASGSTLSTDSHRRVVFLASQAGSAQTLAGAAGAAGHETRTWPHHWSPNTTGNDYKSTESSPHAESKIRLTRGQSNWSDEAGNSSSIPRGSPRQTTMTTTTTMEPSNTTTPSRMSNSADCHVSNTGCKGLRIGVYGWRKRCLYFLVLGLTVIVILNLALTLWLLKVMEFSFEGMGSLKVIPGGIELRGQAAILDALIASSVKSRRGSNLMLESWANFTASARGDNGQVLARFTLSWSQRRVPCKSEPHSG